MDQTVWSLTQQNFCSADPTFDSNTDIKIYSSRSRFFVCSSLFCTRSLEKAAGLALSLGFLLPARATKSKGNKSSPWPSVELENYFKQILKSAESRREREERTPDQPLDVPEGKGKYPGGNAIICINYGHFCLREFLSFSVSKGF